MVAILVAIEVARTK